MKVRLVVMVPTVIEEKYNGSLKDLAAWSRRYVTANFQKESPTAHKDGPIDGRYRARLMESCVLDEQNNMKVILDEMIAPGGLA